MKRAKISDPGRIMLGATVSRRTMARVDAFCRASGMSRGAVLDVAVEAIQVCGECAGTGIDGDSIERCPCCAGHKVLPKNP